MTAPREWVCGISDNHGPRTRQCLRNCHKSENVRTAPESHLNARAYFNVPYRHGRAWRFEIRARRFGNPCLKTVATLNYPVFRREIFGILLNVLETSQTISLLDTVNEVIFLAVIGR